MEKKYKLKVTELAFEDLSEIFYYISENLRAPMAASKLMNEIENKIQSLCVFPYKSPLSSDDMLKQKGYHKLVVENYIVLYIVDEKSMRVIVARVFYGAMDYGKYI
jgi:toxin ParE1/3/4